ncbi:CRO1 protein [Tothia fuscella]|uniref:CRO1 protein n=1 Tax=Tothia fuscella TaxID=1048955 RepID=A0A9P4TSY0_9PEZI|nr:CRO1 protein [Tothia fuscella]
MTASNAAQDERLQNLLTQAKDLVKSGNLNQAADKLKEASSISPGNADVKAAFDELRDEEQGKSLVSHCQKWLSTLSDDDGEIVLDYLHQHQVEGSIVEEAMRVVLSYDGDLDMADQITGELLKTKGARRTLAITLVKNPTTAFSNIYQRGDDSVNGMTDLLLDVTSWTTQDERIAAERDVFQLALAQTMEAGEDNPGRAMKCLSRLLGADATNLKGIIDADGFDIILSYLDIRLPRVLRSQATLATAKLFVLSAEEAQTLIAQYVVKRVKKPTADGLILAFSAAAAVFPMAPQAASNLFLSEGFLISMISMVTKWKSQRLEQSALELLSAACIDKGCRIGIRKTCLDWVKGIAESGGKGGSENPRASQAALILVKIKDAFPEGEKIKPQEEKLDEEAQKQLVARFKSLVLSKDEKTGKQDAIEGLAYSSINPPVKEELANDPNFLEKLVKIMGEKESGAALQFGGLTILANLTAYAPVMTVEQKKLSELKAYANTTKPVVEDQLNGDAHVTARCKKALDAGAIPLFVGLSKSLSPTSQLVVLHILNSLSKEQKHRGVMAQQGAVKLLLQIYDSHPKGTAPSPSAQNTGGTTNGTDASTPTITLSSPQTAPNDHNIPQTAVHALSRILISTNPTHVFNPSLLPLTSAIRPLSTLLIEDATSENRNLLPTFEALLALTNLASTNDTARNAIIRICFAAVEDLLLSNNEMVQRGAVELVCNLCAGPEGVALFADGSPRASNRMHLLLALADSDDLATRKAAGGALAMLTEWDATVEAILQRARGVKILVSMCKDENEEVRRRGVVCLLNLVNAPQKMGERAKQAILKEGGIETVTELIRGTRVREIAITGMEILGILTGS